MNSRMYLAVAASVLALCFQAPMNINAACPTGIHATNTTAFTVCVMLTVDCGAGPFVFGPVSLPPGNTVGIQPPGCCIVSVQVLTPPPACLPQVPAVNCAVGATCPLGPAYPAGATITVRQCRMII